MAREVAPTLADAPPIMGPAPAPGTAFAFSPEESSESARCPEPQDEPPGPRWSEGRALAVTLHDIEPRTFQRVREIRIWLAAHRVDRVTLAVIPAADLHPVGTRAPLLAAWLRAQVARGDAIAQHGLCHRGAGPEFASLDLEESRGRVEAGLGLLREAELDPHGFIAPAYGYTPDLVSVLRERFDWYAERSHVHGRERDVGAAVLGLGSTAPGIRVFSGMLTSLNTTLCGSLMRLDIHPGDFHRPPRRAVIEHILDRASGRQVITYDDAFCPISG
jgi:hypothetical protein